MALVQALEAVINQPGAYGARLRLADEVAAEAPDLGASLRRDAFRLAAGRGAFFGALDVYRNHLAPADRPAAIEALAQRYSADALVGRRRPPPLARPLSVQVPTDGSEQIALARRLGLEIDGLVLPIESTPRVPIFSDLPKPLFIDLADRLEGRAFEAGDTLLAQGEIDRDVWLLAAGQVKVQREALGETAELATVAGPALLGEIALMTAVPRRASVVAVTEVFAWRVDLDALDALAGGAGSPIREQLAGTARSRLLSNLMHQSPVMQAVDDPVSLVRKFTLEQHPAGTVLFKQGAAPPGLYLLVYGQAEVWRAGPAGERTRVAVLTEGDVVGEMSLLGGEPTTAAVNLPEGGVVLHLPAAAWRAVRSDEPVLVDQLDQLAEAREGALIDLIDPLAELHHVDAAQLLTDD